ncbi:hypothetical protein LMG19282_04249 [Cupriavidus campinensis]|uniref:HeH/LEM domain-containing protein n=1 Tax=Cupriavidus campinensis TaxID=151783 RepID=UPI001B015049|nr:HeH/LEM domain-containing protein [Cupriavidus campinensis]CAG2152662.1 hypothetical protein LMG19282_04249 [Cupriavidus campinensis]
MPKLIKLFFGVPDGEIYPREFEPGDECPPELVEGAKSLGALGDEDDGDPPDSLTVAQLRAALDEKGIEYKPTARKAELAELLANTSAAGQSE